AQYRLRDSHHSPEQRTPAADGQFVDPGKRDVVGKVLWRTELRRLRIARIQQRDRREEAGPRISERGQVTVGESPLQLYIECVVPAFAVVREIRDAAELRVRRNQGGARHH